MAKKVVTANAEKIVCLGGGVGTANLIRGLKKYFKDITVIVSMADEGGSAGRLRRLYKVHPVGDLVSCMAALSQNEILSKLLTYRFPGKRYAKKDSLLDGHKLGNLIVIGAIQSTGNFNKAMHFVQQVFNIEGNFLPATLEKVYISAKTIEGKRVFGEEKIDQGKYKGKKILDKVFLHPKNVKASSQVLKKIKEADVIIAGPGDLYTNLLPVLIVPKIAIAIKKSKAKKIYIANVANKPFETKNYRIDDYIKSIIKHLDFFPFEKILVNNNLSYEIPSKYHYKFLEPDSILDKNVLLIKRDLVDKNFPLYHDSRKLAKALNILIYSKSIKWF